MQNQVAIIHAGVIALKINGAGLELIGPERAAGAAEHGLVVDGLGSAAVALSCRPVFQEHLLDIRETSLTCPSQGCSPRFVTGQVGRGTALQQEPDHSSATLCQLAILAIET